MIDETKVHYFIELCSYRNFTKAASHMYISQPTLSRQIQLLEEELGVELIDRDSKKFRLTPEGRDFLELANEYMQQRNLFQMKASQLCKSRTVLRVGFPVELCIFPLVDALQIMDEQYPNVHLSFRSYPQSSLVQQLLANRIDAAFAFRSELEGYTHLNTETIAENYIAVILSNRHPFWGRKSIHPEELQNEVVYIIDKDLCPISCDATIKFLMNHHVKVHENRFDSCIQEQFLRVWGGDCLAISHMYCSELIAYAPKLFSCIPLRGSKIHYGDLTLAFLSYTPEIAAFSRCLRKCTPQIQIED